jgi:uncharacterized protein (TIGR02266 family)
MANRTKRQHRRVTANLAVNVRLANDNKDAPAGRISNISLGGVFIEMEPLPFGTELQLSFRLPDQVRSIVCSGFVVWSTKDRPEAAQASGMQGCGIRLANLSVADMRMLADFVDGNPGS